ncbi:uncharacterized protein PV09_02915 [Verruconis gallopava]|uniref:Uncharacterized protein n=1 Tax=Verruconis gallopava TaxID=253628 RepID=A0A0D2AHX1_9PEZI|nr:uncharacterized protein PV09_02915 [Verruconis gallopava]KIW06478.1 hypothetical protein PV09_02915 [Verruconis gallopava]
MFNSTSSKPLVHLPRPASTSNESTAHLPRGECRYILPVNDAGTRERCSCASFNLNDALPGSQCQCGHQAWHHVQAPSGDFVPVEDHVALVDRCKKLEETARTLLDELKREKRAREKLQADMNTMIRGAYGNMAFLRYYVDEKLEFSRITFEDKIEGALDRAADALNEVDRLKQRVSDLDEACIRLEERMDAGRVISRSLTPVLEEKTKDNSQFFPLANLPLRSKSQEQLSGPWDARLIVVPKKTQRWAFAKDSKAYKRCQSRGFVQDLHFEDKDSGSFNKAVEAAFSSIFKNRPWMPLQCLDSVHMALGQLHMDQRNPGLWTYSFLEAQCMASDKEQGDIIYIALMHEELGWPDIYNLPPVFGFTDNTIWDQDEDLDGKVISARMDFKMDLDPMRVRNLETDSMYEYSPPPYSQRQSIHGVSALGALADAAELADDRRAPRTPSISERSQYSGFSERSRSFAPSISDRSTISGRSIDGTIYEEDEEGSQGHRDKRPKHGAFRPQPGTPGLPSSPPANQAQKMYYSGRAKRKIDPSKQKEPLNWGVSDLKFSNPMKNMLHRKHAGDSKDESDMAKSDTASA